MNHLGCILISVLLSCLYTRYMVFKHNEIMVDHITKTSALTFEYVVKLLKKLEL